MIVESKMNKILDDFSQLYKDQKFNYTLKIDEKKYPLFDVIFFQNNEYISKPISKNDINFSNTIMVHKMKAKTTDFSIIPLLTNMMLGPNTEFQELEVNATTEENNISKHFIFFLNLTNSVQSPSTFELFMTILDIKAS